MLADHLMNGCIKDILLVDAFLYEKVSANILSADDYITLGR